MKLIELHELVAAACPIHGVNSAGEIAFKAEATAPQRAAAQALMDANLPTIDTSDF